MKAINIRKHAKKIIDADRSDIRSTLTHAFIIGDAVNATRDALEKAGFRGRDWKGKATPPTRADAIRKLLIILKKEGCTICESTLHVYSLASHLFTPLQRKVLVSKCVPARDLRYLTARGVDVDGIIQKLKDGRLKPPYNFSRKKWGDKPNGGWHDTMHGSTENCYAHIIVKGDEDEDTAVNMVTSLLSAIQRVGHPWGIVLDRAVDWMKRR